MKKKIQPILSNTNLNKTQNSANLKIESSVNLQKYKIQPTLIKLQIQPTLMLLCFPLLAGWVTMGLAPLDKVGPSFWLKIVVIIKVNLS